MADEPQKDEKTEEATPRRRQEAREKGQVAMSTEFVSALMLVGSVVTLVVGGRSVASLAGRSLERVLRSIHLGNETFEVKQSAVLVRATIEDALPVVAMIVAPALVIGMLTSYLQAGFQVTPKSVGPDLAKVNPGQGLEAPVQSARSRSYGAVGRQDLRDRSRGDRGSRRAGAADDPAARPRSAPRDRRGRRHRAAVRARRAHRDDRGSTDRLRVPALPARTGPAHEQEGGPRGAQEHRR